MSRSRLSSTKNKTAQDLKPIALLKVVTSRKATMRAGEPISKPTEVLLKSYRPNEHAGTVGYLESHRSLH